MSYDKHALEATANQPFGIKFTVNDPGQIHDVDIRKDDKTTVVVDQPTTKDGETQTYVYPGLPAGTYVFICSIHPVAPMTGTLSVK